MAKDRHTPVRWSAWGAAIDFHVTTDKVKRGLKSLNIDPGDDGKYSTHQVFRALADSSGLKSKAADARYQEQIDKSQVMRDKLLENKGDLIRKKDVVEFLADLSTVAYQIIRHSKLSPQEKALMNRQFTDLDWEKRT